MSHRAPPSIPPDFSAPSTERTVVPTRYFGAREKEAEGTIALHIKVLSDSADERLALARIIEAQLRGQRVGSKDVTYFITGPDADSTLFDTGPLEARITAGVMKRLGIK